MNKPLPTSPRARSVERNLFGGLLGMLASTLVARVLLLAFDIPEIILGALLLVGFACGAFAAHYGSRSPETVVVAFRTWNTQLRRISLKVMLCMLALAAVIGVLTVLTASYDTLGRVAGTVVATAIVAGILWPMSVLADRENSQAAGLLGMASVLVVYLLVIPLIWDLDPQEEEMLISSLVIGFTVPFGMFFLSLMNLPATWISARVGVGVYVSVLLTFLVATWHPGGWIRSDSWWVTGWSCAGYGSLSFACLCGLRRFTVDWRWFGVAAAFFAWVLVLISEWGASDPSENLILVISSIAVVNAHTSLAALVPLKPGQGWLRIGTVGAVAAAAMFLDAEVIIAPERGISILGRMSGAASIVASCGSLALIIFARLNRTVDSDDVTLAEITHICVQCPRCQKRMKAPIGSAQCKGCGLQITTAIEEGEKSSS
ncbi:MAG: hypothetical protein QGG36_06215 [Pirellulaceae bacterium]|nr:hypothetical protein [Pirellulaceae bacterium]MDP7015372.1 hypothetical protein [Pirellulaceae bacterium]